MEPNREQVHFFEKGHSHYTTLFNRFFFVHSFLSIIVFLFYLVSLFTIRTLAYKNLKKSKVQFFKMMFLLDSQLKFDVGF